MKAISISMTRFAVCATLLLVSTAAMAADSGKMTLRQTTEIGGKAVEPGEYKVIWQDNGEVSVLKGKKVVATATAKVEASERRELSNSVVTRTADGAAKLSEIRFSGKKQVLNLRGEGAKAVGAN